MKNASILLFSFIIYNYCATILKTMNHTNKQIQSQVFTLTSNKVKVITKAFAAKYFWRTCKVLLIVKIFCRKYFVKNALWTLTKQHVLNKTMATIKSSEMTFSHTTQKLLLYAFCSNTLEQIFTSKRIRSFLNYRTRCFSELK